MWDKILILSALAAFTSCGGSAVKKAETRTETAVDMHTAANSLDYMGTYTGTIPAADCPGIETRIVLDADGTYQLNMEYLERNTGFDEHGTYNIDGNTLTLHPSDGKTRSYYKVEENRLRMLDGNMQVIEGPLAEHYTLKKAQ